MLKEVDHSFQVVLGDNNYLIWPQPVEHKETGELAWAIIFYKFTEEGKKKYFNDREHFNDEDDLIYHGSIILKDFRSAKIMMSIINHVEIFLEKDEREKQNEN